MTEHIQHAAFSITEPRIKLINNLLNMILELVELEYNSEVVEIDGFRLKDLAKWKSYSSNMWENIGSLMPKCNCNCEFCYIHDQPVLSFSQMKKAISLNEIKSRLKHYDVESKQGLIQSLCEYGEPMSHPDLLEILSLYRQYDPFSEISLITNGSYLTEEMLTKMEKYKPISFSISLNAATPETRKSIMKDKNPEVVIKALESMNKHSFPVWAVSIVAWPTIPLAEYENTILFLDKCNARCIRINLPGYTKRRKGVSFSLEYWDQIVNFAQEMRQRVSTPIYVVPNLYEQKNFDAKINGIVRNSPAEKAGLKRGDLILEINSNPITSRHQANYYLSRKNDRLSDSRRVLTILRKDEKLTKIIVDLSKPEDDLYPYKPAGYFNPQRQGFGVLLMDSLDLEIAKEIERNIESAKAKHSFIIGSKLITPLIEPYLASLKKKYDFTLIIPENRFFGGNIFMGDLLVVDDIIDKIKEMITIYGNPDLIMIPATMFINWGKDLRGDSFKKIERVFNIPVKLLQVKKIWQ